MGVNGRATAAPRRVPRQERGERRVAALLSAAADVFVRSGYDTATMSAIAHRAGASIGSLYQFFPNKQAVARALRARWADDYRRLLDALEPAAGSLSLRQFVHRYVGTIVTFVDEHPSFLPLIDAPAATRSPGVREQIRRRIADLLTARQPRLPRPRALRIAAAVQQINKAFTTLYASSTPADRAWVVIEFEAALQGYLASRLRTGRERGVRNAK